MPASIAPLLEYVWAVALGFSAINFMGAARNSKPEYTLYQRRLALLSALPWAVMGVGSVTGTVPSVWYYFRPQDGNLFVLTWFALVLTLSALLAWWIFFAEGARKVIDYKLIYGQDNPKLLSERTVKLLAGLGLAMVPVWVLLVVSLDVPIPR